MSQTLQAWLQRLESLHPKSIDLGLERCARVYRRLGAPRPGNLVWTVAGTNGKGSVTAYLAAMLAATGRSVGLYTSPHILRFNERIRINGVDAGDQEIVESLERVEAARGDISLTYFEFTTLAAFLLFAGRKVDAAVLEVGLGGRLDAVNIVDPDCAVITTIGLDHQDYLGDDRDSIAREKGGIMRAGRPVVIGDRKPPASLVALAGKIGARALFFGRDFDVHPAQGRYSGPAVQEWQVPPPPMSGAHQHDNLAIALTALLTVLAPAELTRAAWREALGSVQIPGRLQRWPGDQRVVLDVGHNPLAAEAVAAFLDELQPAGCSCVLGMLADKDVGGVVQALAPRVTHWFCGGLDGPRGQTGDALAARVLRQLHDPGMDATQVTAFSDIAQALRAARDEAGAQHTILVFGSFQTVADAQVALQGSSAGQIG